MRRLIPLLAFVATLQAGVGAQAAVPRVPAGLARQLPKGYAVLAVASLADKNARHFQIVAIGKTDEDAQRTRSGNSPSRPLLIFEQKNGAFVLAGRNDQVVMRADEGGQCDPFLDSDATIAVKGAFFTVENGIACGEHWTDYITFRLDDHAGFVFDNERRESWSMNPSNAPDADALVPDGPQRVRRDKPGHLTSFEAWKRAR